MSPEAGEAGELLLALELHMELEKDCDAPAKRDCQRCERPRSVCLCASLPPRPLDLAGRVIVLQHPHEHKKRLATVPVLQKCVAGVEVLRCRYYRPELPAHAPLAAALAGAAAGRYPLLVLFPGAGALDVREVAAELHSGAAEQRREQRQWQQQHAQSQQPQAQQPPPPPQHGQQQAEQGRRAGDPLYVLFVIDGTWKQAKEMIKAVAPLVMPPGIRVQLPPAALAPAARSRQGLEEGDPGQRQQQQQQGEGAAARGGGELAAAAAAAGAAPQAAAAPGVPHAPPEAGAAAAAAAGELPLLIRMEPMEGCVTTCEAVARTLGILEPAGAAVQQAILRPLAQLAHFQAQYSPVVAARLQTGAGYSQARRRMGLSKLGDLQKLGRGWDAAGKRPGECGEASA